MQRAVATAGEKNRQNNEGSIPGGPWLFPYCGYKDQIINEHPDVQEPPPGKKVIFIQLVHGFIIDVALYQETDAEKCQGEAPVEEEAGYEQGVEVDM